MTAARLATPLVAILVLIEGAGPAHAGDDCDPPKKPQLKREGKRGTPREDYFFSFYSAAEVNAQVVLYTRLILNQHKDAYLPAEWAEADLAFTRIAPQDCTRNEFESGQPPRTRKATTIRYGPRKQKDLAAELVTTDDNKPPVGKPGGEGAAKVPLRSLVRVSVGEGAGRRTILFRFRSSAERDVATYEAWVGGKEKSDNSELPSLVMREVKFRIPALDQAHAKGEVRKSWRPLTAGAERPTFVATRPGERDTMQVRWGKRSLAEQQVQVILFDADGKPAGRGRVSAYLPKGNK